MHLGVSIRTLLLSKGRDNIDKASVVLDATLSTASLLFLLLLLVNLDRDRNNQLCARLLTQSKPWHVFLKGTVDLPWGFVPSLFQHGPESREPCLRKRGWQNVKSAELFVTNSRLSGCYCMIVCLHTLSRKFAVTSKKPANNFQGAVFWNSTGCQGGTILQRAPSKQQYLVLSKETLHTLDMGLWH